jgi:hypothetical protein
MNPKSKLDQDVQETREPEKKYKFVGFGGYGRDGRLLAISSHYFDAAFELIDLKKKTKHRSEGQE